MADSLLLEAVAARPHANQVRKPLQRIDWLKQALEIFVCEGIEAVRITRLAEDLGVTRGSFYWHFEHRKELIDALVSYWKSKNSPALCASFDNASSLADGIFRFFEICIDPTLFDPRLDLALREWSRRSESIRVQIDQEDSARINSLQAFFIRFGYAMPDALIRARVLYYSQIGFYAIEVQEPLQTRLDYTEAYFECFTGQKLSVEQANDFRQHILDNYGDKLT